MKDFDRNAPAGPVIRSVLLKMFRVMNAHVPDVSEPEAEATMLDMIDGLNNGQIEAAIMTAMKLAEKVLSDPKSMLVKDVSVPIKFCRKYMEDNFKDIQITENLVYIAVCVYMSSVYLLESPEEIKKTLGKPLEEIMEAQRVH